MTKIAKIPKNRENPEKPEKTSVFPNPKREAFFENRVSRAPDFLWAFGTVSR
jgi:hypothetical protein